jgi:hypothetical protein
MAVSGPGSGEETTAPVYHRDSFENVGVNVAGRKLVFTACGLGLPEAGGRPEPEPKPEPEPAPEPEPEAGIKPEPPAPAPAEIEQAVAAAAAGGGEPKLSTAELLAEIEAELKRGRSVILPPHSRLYGESL